MRKKLWLSLLATVLVATSVGASACADSGENGSSDVESISASVSASTDSVEDSESASSSKKDSSSSSSSSESSSSSSSESSSSSSSESSSSSSSESSSSNEPEKPSVDPLTLPDFIVHIPTGKDPVVLQLSDTQIMDAAQERYDGRLGTLKDWCATDQIEERCYDYITETIETVSPDFIIITGDVVYGEFDDSGSALESFVSFMDGFEIPWSPVFGNHDNESTKGVDWQCDLFESSEYCYFEQKTLTGNGNYSVGLEQDGKLLRVFYTIRTY